MVEKNLLTICILEAIEQSTGCLLCYLWSKDESRHMEHLLTNEVVMDPWFREKVVLAKGFCNHHMHLLYRTAREPGVLDGGSFALYMRSVVESIEDLESLSHKSLDALAKRRNFGIVTRRRTHRELLLKLHKTLTHTVKGEQACPACESLSASDTRHSDTLIKMLYDKDFREEFESSNGLCLPHFLSAIRMVDLGKDKESISVAGTLIKVEQVRLHLIAHIFQSSQENRVGMLGMNLTDLKSTRIIWRWNSWSAQQAYTAKPQEITHSNCFLPKESRNST
jgi:hypothetical protein